MRRGGGGGEKKIRAQSCGSATYGRGRTNRLRGGRATFRTHNYNIPDALARSFRSRILNTTIIGSITTRHRQLRNISTSTTFGRTAVLSGHFQFCTEV